MAGLMASRLLGAGGASISGTYVEARTAEVFAGGCIMNGEAVTTGREALLAWKVNHGSFDGVSLNGLAVVAAVAGDTNLGIREFGGGTAQTRTALFVDERANPAQRAALVSMAQQYSKGVLGTVVQLTPTAIQFVDEGPAIRVSAKSLRLSVEREITMIRPAAANSGSTRSRLSTALRWARPTRTRSAARRWARSGAIRTSARRSSARLRTRHVAY